VARENSAVDGSKNGRIESMEEDKIIIHIQNLLEIGAIHDALILDDNVAKSTPCTCYSFPDKTDMCWSAGAIGTLLPSQEINYCTEKITRPAPAKLKERREKFLEAVNAAQARIKDVPKGERLIPWLESMSSELEKRGIEI